MAESWDPELLSAILKSSAPGLDKASHDPAFPLLSPAAADNIRTTSPSSTAGCVLRIFQNLLDHDESVQAAADNLGSLISRHCTEDSEDATLLWGAICQRAETWPAAKTSMLCDLVVELAKLSYALPAYPYDTDEPVQGTSSLSELPGFGQELVGRMQGPKNYSLLFMTPEARNDPSSRSPESMTRGTVSGQVVIAVRNLYRNIHMFAALLSRRHIEGSLTPQPTDNRGMACHPIVAALENELSDNEILENVDGSTLMADQDWAAFTRAQPSIELPAAAQWLLVLGNDLYKGIAGHVLPAGHLWKLAGGNDEITAERWSFWQHRLRELATQDTILGGGMTELCKRAANRMD